MKDLQDVAIVFWFFALGLNILFWVGIAFVIYKLLVFFGVM